MSFVAAQLTSATRSLFSHCSQAADDDNGDGGRGGGDLEEVHGAQHTLVLIDARPSMFEKSIELNDGETTSPMQASLQACDALLKQKVKHVAIHRTGKRDGVGIILYGLPGSKDYTYTLLDLAAPGIQQILKIQDYASGKKDIKDEIPKEGPIQWSLRRGLQQADKEFNTAK